MQARTTWPAVSAALAAGVVAASYVGKLPPALPALKAEFALSLVAAGWVVSLFNLLAAVAGIFFGLLSDRAGALRACFVGLLLLGAGGLTGALAQGEITLLTSRFVEGVGFISVSVAAAALIFTASAAADRRLTLGIWSAYLPLGFAATIVAAPPLMAIIGWRGLWLGLVAATAASIAALATQRAHYPTPAASSRTFASIVDALRQPGPWWVAGAMGFYTAQWTSVMVWLPTFLVQERSLSLFMASVATALAVIANIPGILAGTWLLGRQVERGTLIAIAAALMGACGVASLLSLIPDWLRYACCLGLSFVGGAIPAAVLTSPQQYARSAGQVGSLQGLIMQGSNIGQLIAPPAVAAVVSASGYWDAAGWVIGAAAGCAAVCGIAVRRINRSAHFRSPRPPGT
jgi:MFS family permease